MISLAKLVNRLRNRVAVFGHDLFMIPIAWFGAYWLRFNLEAVPSQFLERAFRLLPVVLLVQGAVAWFFGLYRGLWRYASLRDLARIIKAVTAGTAILVFAAFLITRMEGVPRSVFPLYGILLIGLLGGPRLVYRWLKDRRLYAERGVRVLIVGAGRAGEMLVRDLLSESPPMHEPDGFVDDDENKVGKEIHGVRVLGRIADVPKLVRELDIELVLIAVPSASSADMRRIVGICEQVRVPFRTLPRTQDLATGQIGFREIREVRIEDLLGREKVTLDWGAISAGLEGRSVMVTGGGGSIGAELCRQIAKLRPLQLVVFEQSEFNLYQIDMELRQSYPQLSLTSVLGDVGDAVAVELAMKSARPAVVFHAAAYKHVPMLEHQVRAAALNNVLGTRVVADKAAQCGCHAFVLISSDKAVNPANIMGATKCAAEMYCHYLNESSNTHFITVRFGNVLGSAGSVIPLFREQIARGGPVTVTHPEITRYFMSIPEACQLILQASVIGEGGEIYVLEMGEPIKISYLAEQLIQLSGKRPGKEIEIAYTGLRPGEKLYEELFHDAETLTDTRHPKIRLARCRTVSAETISQIMIEMDRAVRDADEGRIVQLLSELVPEYAETSDTSLGRSDPALRSRKIVPGP